ncbi:MAG: LicD family protein [Eggerthellaceae bacterium]|nr:LicD family protein [Eggerthellaceae bacterium]
MNAQQEYLLGLLREIHELCIANDITYYIVGGTLLGALRNGGFLPWDDDADIWMTQENYRKFIEVCKTQLPENRHFGSPETSETYGNNVPRYVSKDTTSIHTCQSLHDDIAGVVIDVFILDPVADGDEAYEAYLQDLYQYGAVINYANAVGARFEIDAEEFKRNIALEREQGRAAVVDMFEKRLATHFDPDGEWYVLRWCGVPERLKRSWFEETILVEFEGLQLMAPKACNEYLTQYFGEEWIEVPGSVTPGKHNTATSLAIPYTEALEYYEPTIPREKIHEEVIERQYQIFADAKADHFIKNSLIMAQSRIVVKDLEKKLAQNRAAFEEALEQEDAATLMDLLGDYISWQMNTEVVGRRLFKFAERFFRPILIDVPDEVFEGALIALVGNGRVGHASRMLQLHDRSGKAHTPRMAHIAHLIETMHDAADAYQYGRYEAGYESAKSLLNSGNLKPVAFYRLAFENAWARYLEGDAETAWRETAVSILNEGIEAYPEEGLLLKFKADIEWHDGEQDTARMHYLTAAESTRNGIALNDITKKTGYHPSWLRKPAWAREVGIPQWSGEEPKPLAKPPVKKQIKPEPDKRQDYLLGLLAELAEILDDSGIEYLLAPDLACALEIQRKPSATIADYGIIIKPADAPKAAKAIVATAADNRFVGYMGTGMRTSSQSIEYFGTDSVYIEPRGNYRPHIPCLGTWVQPVEPTGYPTDIKKMLSYWHTGKEPSKTAKRLAFRAYCALKGIEAGSAKSGEKLYGWAMAAAAQAANDGTIARRGKRVPFDLKFFDDPSTVDYGGRSFKVPHDIEGYANAFSCTDEAGALAIPAGSLCSYVYGMKECMDEHTYEKIVAAQDELKRTRASKARTLKHFRNNFAQQLLAVRLKELSVELKPRKDEILALDAAGDKKALKSLLSGYLACAREFDGVGPMSFDDDIYRIMKKLR